MKVLTWAAFGAAPVLLSAGAAIADCGDVVIASMNWQSAEVLSNVDQIILN